MRSLKSGFVGFIRKQKQEKNTMVPCGRLTKRLHGSSVGISFLIITLSYKLLGGVYKDVN